ncbi:MAG: fatty oxidation complex subunit alpha [Bradymonadales bacterium]|nr:MAG: fatty oxidation complex subunit alpha [Bradymonadales bacterium]
MEAGAQELGQLDSPRHTELIVHESERAEIVVSTPEKSVNILTRECFQEFREHFAILKAKPGIKTLVIYSKKPGVFFAGADLNEIYAMKSKDEAFSLVQEVQDLFNELESLPQVTVAAIDGICMGGGLELALACNYRVCSNSPKTKLALPEVMLGVLPGAGGTQRLPKVLPLLEAIKMITSGAAVDSRKALKIGLVSDVMPSERMLEIVREKLKDGSYKRWDRKQKFSESLLRMKPVRSFIFSQAKKQILAKTKGFYPAPLKALSVVERTASTDLKTGLSIEAAGFVELATGPVAKNLMGIFFADEELKKTRGVGAHEAPDFKPKKIDRVGVLGAGIMGGGISAVAAKRGIQVRVKDISEESLGTALKTANDLFKRDFQRRKIDLAEFQKRKFRISTSLEWQGFRQMPLVIEAVVEKMEVKVQVLKELEALLSPDAVIASNTSSLSISQMAAQLKNPQRMVGLHFFNPVPIMPLVEVVRAEQSSPEAVMQTLAFARALGKKAIVVKDRPGFLINRILMPYLIEASHLRQDGYSVLQVDKAATRFGMPMGPFRLLDEIGLDTAAKVADTIASAFPHMKVLPLIHELAKKGYLGKKNGKGFYEYDAKGKSKGVRSDFSTAPQDPSAATDSLIQDRLILPMLTEASMALEEGVVETIQEVDFGLIYGIGFPPFHGGLLKWVSSEGERNILDRFNVIHNATKGRLMVAKDLVQRVKSEQAYYPSA